MAMPRAGRRLGHGHAGCLERGWRREDRNSWGEGQAEVCPQHWGGRVDQFMETGPVGPGT